MSTDARSDGSDDGDAVTQAPRHVHAGVQSSPQREHLMQERPWHALRVEEILTHLDTDPTGLSEQEAARRLARDGPNQLTPPAPASALAILLDQLRSVVVVLLIAAMVISLLLGDRLEAVAIGVVLVINTALGFFTELRARRAMEALLRWEAPHATVVRAGRSQVVEARLVVPGDVIEVRTGQRIPADARLIESSDLRTDEAALTGESFPIAKRANTLSEADTTLAERINMIYMGATVVAGTARAVVTGTGAASELGRIGTLVAAVKEGKTPLERRLDALGQRLVWLSLGVAGLVAALGFLQGASLGLVVQTGIALAVAAVPEALPAVATIALAVGLRRMARRHALVRRLPAVEALGSTTVVCTDKTRTLTSGDMSVVHVWTPGGELCLRAHDSVVAPLATMVHHALEVGLASQPPPRTSDDALLMSDPVDAALLRAARRAGVDPERVLARRPPVGVVPFSSERKLMASFHHVDGRIVAYVKGAPRRLLELSDRLDEDGGNRRLDEDTREYLFRVNADLARRGLRVLGLASGVVAQPTESALRGLRFLGFVGLMDPPAVGVRDTIARLHDAGLRTIMITGDQRLTAEAVGRELGVVHADGQVIDGRELRALSAADLTGRLGIVAAFSRVAPDDKLTIVRALQARGDIVAMLGDGVNDAPALKQADVGVAMGRRGTDVAKEAASMVLQDDRFETIAAAVEEGRIIYDNIRKFVFYLFSCNVAEVLVLLGAGLAGLPLPLLPLQILWLNMVTDTFPALALAMEPGDANVMHRPPRDPKAAILSRIFLGRILFYGGLITAVTLVGFVATLGRPIAEARTMSFMTLALAQIFHLGNARSVEPVLRPRQVTANRYALGAVALAVTLQIIALSIDPLPRVLGLAPLGLGDWALVVTLAAVPAAVGQGLKLARRARRG